MSGWCPGHIIRPALLYAIQSDSLLALIFSIESISFPDHLQCLTTETNTTNRESVRSNTEMKTTSVGMKDTSRRPALRLAVAVTAVKAVAAAVAALAAKVVMAITPKKKNVTVMRTIVRNRNQTSEPICLGVIDHPWLTFIFLVLATQQPWACA